MDEQQREHVRDDLKGLIRGDLLFDDLSRALYSSDASIFQIKPLGVAAPRDEEDVQALVRYAAEHHIPLIPRGAGTGVAGESLGSGIILDMSRYFRAIVAVGEDWARVQPGVIHRDLNVRLARQGRRFAPDPASGGYCTIGGMLASNASGARALRHGYTRDHVEQIRAVLDNGDPAVAAQTPRAGEFDQAGRWADVQRQLRALFDRHQSLLQTNPVRTRFNRCGYLLHDVLSDGHMDLARLLVGSEGTLALFTEATLRTIPLPAGRSLVFLAFANLDAALKAVPLCLASGPSACELIEHRLLTLAREHDPALASLVPAGAEVVLLVEYEADSEREAWQAALALADLLQRGERLAIQAVPAAELSEIERLWSLREIALPNLYGMRGGAHPLAFVEDVGVPVDELPTYLRRVQDIMQKYETTASFLVHACTGQVHTRPFLDLQKPADAAKLWAIADEVHSLALDLKGTVSTQHGTGLARTPWVPRQYGKLYSVMREIKAIFDPHSLFNPGKIIGPEPGLPSWPLRKEPRVEFNVRTDDPALATRNGADSPGTGQSLPTTHLAWKPREIVGEVSSCNGCGQCRTSVPGQRMCPIFRATHEEAAAPRAKANLLRHLLENTDDARLLTSDTVREVADLCVNCKMCAQECPAHVNIPKLMLEVKAANVAEHGLNRADWVLARIESFAAFGSSFAFVVNTLLGSHWVRWLLEKLFHVSRKRRLPTFASRSFLQRAARRGLTRLPHSQRPCVVYFVDVFANYNDPQIAEAVVAVLRHNGFEVFVPPGQVGCGVAPLAQGDVEAAREAAQTNLRVLADLAREGYSILCSEPTAALMLRNDYRDLFDTPDARLVAERTVEFTHFLWDLHRRGKLRTDFRRLEVAVGHHVPCHLKALGQPPRGPALLSLIPGLRVHTIDVSCSGMAGTFGLKAESYEASREAGRPMLDELKHPRVLFGSTECSTCRLQMEDGSGKRALHPAQYLALAYGLMPELSQRLSQPVHELLLT